VHQSRRVLGPALVLLAAGCAADPAPGGGGDARAALQGNWRAMSAERNGAPAPELVGHELAFAGERFRISGGGRPLFGGTYSIDPAARPPRIDFRQEEGGELRGTWRGIYRLEGRELLIVDNAADMQRPAPTQFATAPGSGLVMVRFLRP